MIQNYKEALEHFYNIDMLNEKGLKELLRTRNEYINLLLTEKIVLDTNIENIKLRLKK